MSDETTVVEDVATVGCLDSLADAVNLTHNLVSLLERIHVLPDNPVTHFLMDHTKDLVGILKKIMKK